MIVKNSNFFFHGNMIQQVLLALLIMGGSQLIAFNGLYVGGSLGGHIAEGAQSGSILGTFSTSNYPTSLQTDMFDREISGLFYTGYGLSWRSLYLAGEGFLQFGYAKLQSEQISSNLTISTNTVNRNTSTVDAHVKCVQGGFDLLPGWILNPATLLYGRIGVGAARAHLKTASTNIGQSIFGSGTLSLPLSTSETFTTLHAGVGLEQRLNSRFSLRGDYIFTDYGKLSVQGSTSGTSSGFGFPMTLIHDSKLHLYDHAVMLGLSYHIFCREPLCYDTCYATQAFDGCYVGGTLGGSILTNSQDGFVFQANTERNDTTQTAQAPSQLYNNQFQGMLFLGRSDVWKKAYLASELFASAVTHSSIDFTGETLLYSTTNDTLYSTSYDTSVKSSIWQYGFDLRPGFVLMPLTLLYGRVGISAAQIKADSTTAISANNGTGITWSLSDSPSVHSWKAAFRLGLGVEQLLSPKLHLRGDYIFTNYGVVLYKSTVSGQDSEGDPTTSFSTLSSHLQNNAILIGLTYYFH